MESAFCIGVTIQDLKGKFTSKNDIETSKYTNWGTNETNSGGVEDCAVIFLAFFTTERMTYAYIWCPFVKWIQPCIRNFY